ncbi:hypothetical protein [Lentzea aerocolonigenes]|nr:hypothetical protein [Lentzea aerocolonigenes]MCP2249882.1 hypothetical protein [Lentzea aerocolonigenes]
MPHAVVISAAGRVHGRPASSLAGESHGVGHGDLPGYGGRVGMAG